MAVLEEMARTTLLVSTICNSPATDLHLILKKIYCYVVTGSSQLDTPRGQGVHNICPRIGSVISVLQYFLSSYSMGGRR